MQVKIFFGELKLDMSLNYDEYNFKKINKFLQN